MAKNPVATARHSTTRSSGIVYSPYCPNRIGTPCENPRFGNTPPITPFRSRHTCVMCSRSPASQPMSWSTISSTSPAPCSRNIVAAELRIRVISASLLWSHTERFGHRRTSRISDRIRFSVGRSS